jgi:thiol-disulfide isomerase/thioredoxin
MTHVANPVEPGATRDLFAGATGWLNSPPLAVPELRGNVVLVDFWTYTCINWLRTLPYIRAWHERYRDHGLVVVGVHTPEFPFERDGENVRQAVQDMGIEYAVAVDNAYAIWQAFDNHFWPALYLIDVRGNMRHHQNGEGAYDRTELVLQRLLVEAGDGRFDRQLVSVDPSGIEADADWDSLRSAENYLGYERTVNLAPAERAMADEPQNFHAPDRLQLNHWSPEGVWTIGPEAARLNQPAGRIEYRFHARDLHLVMGPAKRGESVRFRVRIDGEPPGHAHGLDVDDNGYGTVTQQRLYQLIRQPDKIVDRQFEIEFLDPDIEAYAFTFG